MDVTKLTAEFMSNRKFGDKWDGSDPMSVHQAFLNDVEFYRERATELTVALLNEREAIEPYLTKDVVSAFNTYMRACICFFRSKDMNDINQKEYLGDEGFSTFAIKTEQELEAEAWQELEALCGEDPTSEVPYQLADTIMMRQITLKTQPNTLDRFLKYEKIEESPIILPQQKEIDLEHPDLKKKPFFPPKVLPPEPPVSRSGENTPEPPSTSALSPPEPAPPAILPPVNTPYPPLGEKSIKDVMETATEIMEEILSCVVNRFETEKEPEGCKSSPEEKVSSGEVELVDPPTQQPEEKNKNKKKNKRKKPTSKLGEGEALHVDI
jgi:hypothetical protein